MMKFCVVLDRKLESECYLPGGRVGCDLPPTLRELPPLSRSGGRETMLLSRARVPHQLGWPVMVLGTGCGMLPTPASPAAPPAPAAPPVPLAPPLLLLKPP